MFGSLRIPFLGNRRDSKRVPSIEGLSPRYQSAIARMKQDKLDGNKRWQEITERVNLAGDWADTHSVDEQFPSDPFTPLTPVEAILGFTLEERQWRTR